MNEVKKEFWFREDSLPLFPFYHQWWHTWVPAARLLILLRSTSSPTFLWKKFKLCPYLTVFFNHTHHFCFFTLSLSLTHFYDSVIVFAMMYLYSWIYSIMLPLIQDTKFKIMQKVKFNFLCLLLNYFIKVTKIQTSFCKEKQINKSGFLYLFSCFWLEWLLRLQ